MINFEKIEIKNLLTYGNSPTVFNFDNGVIRIRGENQSGKSSLILDGIYFALFGKPYRNIKLSQLVNCINKKNLEVTIWFSKNNISYRIERGIKENYFRIYENDIIKPIPPSSRSYQTMLEEDILQMTVGVFEQLSMKSLTKSFSFFSLKKEDKRKVIENILNTGIYSQMNKAAKDCADVLTKEIADIQKDISNLNLLISQETQNLTRLESIQRKQLEDNTTQNNKLQEENNNLLIENDNSKNLLLDLDIYKNEKNVLCTTQKQIDSQYATYTKQKLEVESKISLTRTKVEFLKSTCGECPNIKQMIVDDNIDELLTKKKSLTTLIQELENTRRDIQNNINSCNQKLANEQNILSQISFNVRKINQNLQSMKQQNSQVIIIDKTQLDKYKQQLITNSSIYNDKCKDKKHYIYARQLLSDENIKAYVVDKYLPAINDLLNYYLQRFGSSLIFRFNSEFDEEICSKNKENFSYESFSEGGKRKIDLAILFTFIDFLDYKFGDVNNLLILDEISSTLDSYNENILYEILKELSEKKNKCIITISHSGNIESERIDHLYDVIIENGFSKLTKI